MRKEIIVQKNPKSPISEIFRTLRTNIQFMDINKKMKSLLVTSTFPGEGKSWVAANLAVTFAQADKKVILIDADMRKGRQYAMFEVSPKPGLSNYLSLAEIDENGQSNENIGEYIQETDVKNLYVITAGNVPPNPSELLVSAQMINLLERLKQLCDIVIIDGTPCELVTDSVILSRIVDSTIIVTAHKKTKKDALEKVIRNIQNVGGQLAGVVFNKVPITSKKYGEQYYYYGSTAKSSTKKESSKKEQERKKNVYNDATEREIVKLKENVSTVNTNELKKETQQSETAKNAGNGETLNKTNEILQQINEYLENEKKKIK